LWLAAGLAGSYLGLFLRPLFGLTGWPAAGRKPQVA